MKNETAISILEEAASAQWGMFTTAQAKRLGVSRQYIAQLAKKGKVERLSSSVYRLSSSPTTAHDDIKASWLSTNPEKFAYERLASKDYDVVVTGATAACLYEVGDLYAAPYTFATKTRRQTQRADIRYLRSNWTSDDVTLIDGLPTARPEKVITDLVRVHEDPSLISDVAIDFERTDRTVDLGRLANELSAIRGNRFTPEDFFAGYDGYPLMIARERARVVASNEAVDWKLLQEAFTQTAAIQKNVDRLQASLQDIPDISQFAGLQEQLEQFRTAQDTLPSLSPSTLEAIRRYSDLVQRPDIQAAIRSYQNLMRNNEAIQQSLSKSAEALKVFAERYAHE